MSRSGKFLIASWDAGGNTPPALNLGARLTRRGHRVRLLGWESMAGRSAAAGLDFAAYKSLPPWPQGLALDDDWDVRAKSALHGPATRDDIIAEAREFDPDVLVVDCMLGAGYDAAAWLCLPMAVLVHVMYAAFRFTPWADMMLEKDAASVLDGAGAVLALTPPGFDDPCDPPANTTYVGPITRPLPREQADWNVPLVAQSGDPWVLLSLSTTLQGQADALPPMLDAVAALPIRVLLTLGGVVSAAALDLPPNVTARDFVPHDLVLPHTAAVVSHGGLSTITNALAVGVPILCIPQGRDQAMNATRVEACGVGRALSPGASATEIEAALQELLADDSARTEARRFAGVISGLGGGDLATSKVEELWQGQLREPAIEQPY